MSETLQTRPFAPFEWLISLRYLRARRKEGFISVIAGFSFLGIMLGVATLIIVMAVMNGFRKELLDKILGLNGHLLVQPLESPLTDWKVVADRINAVAGIRLAARSSRDRRLRRRRSVRPACWCAASVRRI
jgi:lipoprotein-releasing system permease protein